MLIDLAGPCTQAEFAAIVGVTQQSISTLLITGALQGGGSSGDLLLEYCHRLREQAAGRMGAEVGGLDLVQERAALAREQRMGIEIKNAVLRGEFAPISVLAEVLATASQSIVERFEQIPGLLKKNCPDLPDAAREQVMTALAAARNEWVRATEALVSTKASAEHVEDSTDMEEIEV